MRQIHYRRQQEFVVEAALHGKKVPQPSGYIGRNEIEFSEADDLKAERAMQEAMARKLRERRG